MIELYNNLLIEAKKQNKDVFNCLDIMDNKYIFEKLKFEKGDGNLNYYLFNYSFGKNIDHSDIGIVLV